MKSFISMTLAAFALVSPGWLSAQTTHDAAETDALVAKLKAAPQEQREALLCAHLRAIMDALPSIQFQFKTFAADDLVREGTSTASLSGLFRSTGLSMQKNNSGERVPREFRAYRLREQRGFWQQGDVVAQESFSPHERADEALTVWLRQVGGPNPLLSAYGDGTRTVEQILREFEKFPRKIEIEEKEHVRVVISLFHVSGRNAVAPFKRIELAPELGWVVDRIEGRWEDGRLESEIVITRRERLARGETVAMVPVEYVYRNHKYERESRRYVITNLTPAEKAVEAMSGDLVSLCGALPQGMHLSRTFADGSSILYVVSQTGALLPEQVEAPELARNDELFLDTGQQSHWRQWSRAAAALIALGAIVVAVARLYRRRSASGTA